MGEEIRGSRAKEFRCTGVQLGYRYSGSPICVPDGIAEPPDEPDEYVPSTWPGCDAPHVWLPDGSSVLDHFGRGFTLVVSRSSHPTPLVEAARGCGVPLTVLRLADPVAAELYERPLVLVRPGGHVGWRGRQAPADPVAVLDVLRGATVTPPDAKAPEAARTVSARVGTHLVCVTALSAPAPGPPNSWPGRTPSGTGSSRGPACSGRWARSPLRTRRPRHHGRARHRRRGRDRGRARP